MIGETAQLVVQLTLKDQLSGGVSKAERSLTGLNATTRAGVGHMSVLSVAAGKVTKSIGGLGGALSHASGKIGGLLTGPLGLIGLTGGILGLGGAIESSVKKVEEFGLGLEKLQGLTGESATSAGTLILLFDKYGLGVDRVTQIAGFAEKTLGKLNETQAKGAKSAKSATLQNLELVKAQRQAAGESTKAINKLISEQKAKDQIANAAAGQAASVTKLAALDKTYGLQLLDTKGKVVSFSQVLSQLADLYDRKNVPASTKAYVASQVLGRGYAALIPILTKGSGAIAEAAKEAQALDLGHTADEMVKFRDVMRNLGEQVNVLQMRIGLALVPALTDAAKAISDWLGHGGDTQIIGFFKSGAIFAQQMGHAIETTVVPAFKAISGAWNSIPGPLKDLLIGGFIANKAGKFLFDKSLFGGLKNLLGMGVSRIPIIGGAVAGGLGVQHVWVDNMGMGGMGGLPLAGGAAAPAAVGGGALAGVGLVPTVAAAGLVAAGVLTSAYLVAHFGDKTANTFKFQSGVGSKGQVLRPGFASNLNAGTIDNPILSPISGRPAGETLALGELRKLTQATIADHIRSERADARATGALTSIASTMTALQQQLHADFADAIHALRQASDPAAILAAAKRVTEDMWKGVGSGKTTKATIGELTVKRDALLAAGDKTNAATLTAEIRKISRLVPGREHQAALLAQGKKIVASSESAKQKITDLTRIENTLKTLHRTTAATAIQKQIELINAVNRTTAAVNALPSLGNVTNVINRGGPGGETIPALAGPALTPGYLAGKPGQGHAAGLLGMTNGLTSLGGLGVTGEAGKEAVAIVKNPKALRASISAARVFVTNWPSVVDQISKSGAATAAATSSIAKETVKQATQKQMVAALKAIKERAIAAGHQPTIATEKATYAHDVKRGISLDRILHAPIKIVAEVSVSTRDVNNKQAIRRRYGPTPTQAGAM